MASVLIRVHRPDGTTQTAESSLADWETTKEIAQQDGWVERKEAEAGYYEVAVIFTPGQSRATVYSRYICTEL